MPAQGRGPRAGGGAQRPEPPSEVRSPRPRLVERAGGRANPRGRYRKGGRLKITLSGWEARARSLASFGARGLQGRWRWGGQRGIPPPPRGGVPACAPRLHVCGAARPGPLHPAGGRPLPRPGRSWRWPPPAACAAGGKRSIIHYLRALIGLRHRGGGGGGGRGRRGDRGLRGRGGEGGGRAGAGLRRGPRGRGLRLGPGVPGAPPPAAFWQPGAGAARGAGREARPFDCASRPLSSASSPFPRRGEGAVGRTPRPARPSRPPPRPRRSPGLIYHHLWSSGVCKEQLLHSADFRGRIQRESGR